MKRLNVTQGEYARIQRAASMPTFPIVDGHLLPIPTVAAVARALGLDLRTLIAESPLVVTVRRDFLAITSEIRITEAA